MIGGEKLIQNYTPAERRGREANIQIRDAIHLLRWRGIEPKAVWIGKSTADDMCALWSRMCGPGWDGRIEAKIAGVPVRVGSTAGHDFLFEYFETAEETEARRLAMEKQGWHASANPLQGTH